MLVNVVGSAKYGRVTHLQGGGDRKTRQALVEMKSGEKVWMDPGKLREASEAEVERCAVC